MFEQSKKTNKRSFNRLSEANTKYSYEVLMQDLLNMVQSWPRIFLYHTFSFRSKSVKKKHGTVTGRSRIKTASAFSPQRLHTNLLAV